MMKLVAKSSLLIAFALFFTSCEKDQNTDSSPKAVGQSSSTMDLKIPNGFNFETTYTDIAHLNTNMRQQMGMAHGSWVKSESPVFLLEKSLVIR